MKTVLLTASLLLNAALLGVLFSGASSHTPTSTAASAPAPASPPQAEAAPAVWAQLESAELPGFVERLRAAGFPAHVIRAMVTAEVQRQFAPRIRALNADAGTHPFWKQPANESQTRLAQMQLWREQQRILRDLLGEEGDALVSPYQKARHARTTGFLPAEKANTVKELIREFESRRQEVYASSGGSIGTLERERLEAVARDERAEIARVLTPQELEEYDLRASRTAESLRFNLVAFDASEQEFRTLFKLQQAFDQQFGAFTPGASLEEQRRRSDAQRQLNEQIKLALGPERGAEYERATNFEYRTTKQLVTRLELPPETATQIWSVRESVMKRAEALRQSTAPNSAERVAQMTALQTEAATQIAAMLGGAHRLDSYKQYGGRWLQMLVPPTTRSPTSPQ